MQNDDDELFDEDHCTWHIWNPEYDKLPQYVPISSSFYTVGHLGSYLHYIP